MPGAVQTGTKARPGTHDKGTEVIGQTQRYAQISEGDQVWLEGRHLRTNQPTTKLAPRRHGPFKVVQVMSDVNYCLELPTQWSIHRIFHTDLLTPYRETPTHRRNYQRPPPELVDEEEEYKVEKILDQRQFGRRRKLQYLVKWRGYPDSENQWVDSTDIFADKAIREFQNSNPTLPTHKSKRKFHRNRHLLSSLLTYMTSPSPLPIPPRNDTPLDVGTTDYFVSRILGMLIEPERGWVLPDFIEYQDTADTGVEGGDDQMEARAIRASLTALEVPIRIPSTSDIAEVRCHPDDHLSPNSHLNTTTTNTTVNFTSFQKNLLDKSMRQLRGKPPQLQLGRQSMRLLLRTSSPIPTTTTPTKRTMTPTKKTTKMPRKY